MKIIDLKVNLSTINSVKEFVNLSMQFEGTVDLMSGRYAVDGKSIMGIFSLDLSKAVACHIEGDDENSVNEFVDTIRQFIEE